MVPGPWYDPGPLLLLSFLSTLHTRTDLMYGWPPLSVCVFLLMFDTFMLFPLSSDFTISRRPSFLWISKSSSIIKSTLELRQNLMGNKMSISYTPGVIPPLSILGPEDWGQETIRSEKVSSLMIEYFYRNKQTKKVRSCVFSYSR